MDLNRQFNLQAIGGRKDPVVEMSHGIQLTRYWLQSIADFQSSRHQIYPRYRQNIGSLSVTEPSIKPLGRLNANL